MSEKAKKRKGERNSMFGRHRSEETKLKISNANKGKLAGNKHPMFGKTGKANPMFGRHHSEETKKKMRAAALQRIPYCTNTSIELKVKQQLKEYGIEFLHPWNLEPYYQCDFYVPSLNLIIECDGDYWHSLEKKKIADKRKNAYAKNQGYGMLRLPEFLIRSPDFDIIKYLKEVGGRLS